MIDRVTIYDVDLGLNVHLGHSVDRSLATIARDIKPDTDGIVITVHACVLLFRADLVPVFLSSVIRVLTGD